MGIIKTAKKNALLSLRGKWGITIAITLLLQVVTALFAILRELFLTVFDVKSGVLSFEYFNKSWTNFTLMLVITLLIMLFTFLVQTPISLGAMRWFYKNAGGKTAGFYSVFSYMQTTGGYAKAIWFWFNLYVRLFAYGCLFLLPGTIIGLVGLWGLYINGWAGPLDIVLVFTGIILFVIGFIGYYLVTLRYFLAPYYFFDNPDIKVRDIIKVTVQFSKTKTTELVKLTLSFIGWELLNLLVFPILFTLPYKHSTYAIVARVYIEQINQTNKEVE